MAGLCKSIKSHLRGAYTTDDRQNHLMECVIIKVSSKKVFNNEKAKYEDIFGHNVTKIKQIVEIMEDALRCRELLLEN